MCDYSLEFVASRPAVVGDKLIVNKFVGAAMSGTTGFSSPEDRAVAVCVLPGTEIAFDAPIAKRETYGEMSPAKTYETSVAVFAQLDTEERYRHHDALQMADGQTVLLNHLVVDQTATVLQLPKQVDVMHVELPADCEASTEAPALPELVA